ncbi:MAG: hypothetical protein PHY47_24845 [Lachnospiraceae bacterium]|nr:hypothetical protein [Lachnospiraceae bacterium]
MENFKEKYQDFLLPVTCLLLGILVGILLSPIKNGFEFKMFSENNAGCNNSAEDSIVGGANKNKSQ